MKLESITFAGLVIIFAVAIIIIVSTKTTEPFTELYFKESNNLPIYSYNNSFLFAINNQEAEGMEYYVQISAESAAYKKNISKFRVKIPKGKSKTFLVPYTIPDFFGTGKIIVELPLQNQKIFFWTKYSEKQMNYFGKQLDITCVPHIVSTTGNLSIKLTGEYFPRIVILQNASPILNLSLNGTETFNLSDINGLVDIWFTNDAYDKDTGLDRNLRVEYIKTDGTFYEEILIDKGKNMDAFDCSRTVFGNSLFNNGAMRIYVDVDPDYVDNSTIVYTNSSNIS